MFGVSAKLRRLPTILRELPDPRKFKNMQDARGVLIGARRDSPRVSGDMTGFHPFCPEIRIVSPDTEWLILVSPRHCFANPAYSTTRANSAGSFVQRRARA